METKGIYKGILGQKVSVLDNLNWSFVFTRSYINTNFNIMLILSIKNVFHLHFNTQC